MRNLTRTERAIIINNYYPGGVSAEILARDFGITVADVLAIVSGDGDWERGGSVQTLDVENNEQ